MTCVLLGPDWVWNDQDGGTGNIGSVLRVGRDGIVLVRLFTKQACKSYLIPRFLIHKSCKISLLLKKTKQLKTF